jgi:hypothetical protein
MIIYILCSRIPELIINQQGWVSQNHCSRFLKRAVGALYFRLQSMENGPFIGGKTPIQRVIFYSYVNVYQRLCQIGDSTNAKKNQIIQH